ncbi:MAG: 23S rRNA (adenine(2503)-C(2))-methyltransferase RlmN [Dehalococcoidia bacterium]|jgi:23S rRNA (adenine2503-C2)-methyltransferase
MKKLLLGLSDDELKLLAVEAGEKEYRGKQIADLVYRHGCREVAAMSNLPAKFRTWLDKDFAVGRSQTTKIRRDKDRTFKVLLRPAFGDLIESVGMAYEDRFSCCVSTQVGCAIGCSFCATGAGGFKRNLAAGEIIDQVLTVGEVAIREKMLTPDGRVSHVVFMGMGEPLMNYDATLTAVKLLNSELNVGMRNITISTIGYVPGIYRLAREHLQLTLAISLHASDDILRRRLVPGMSRYSLKEIVESARDYFKETGRRVTFEYCLLMGVNDSLSAAAGLAALLKGVNCHVNLIPLNPVEGKNYKPPWADRAADFRRVLEDAGIPVTQREQRGAGIEAACGQLRRKAEQ